MPIVGGLGASFRRLPLFPVGGADAGQLVPVYAPAFAAARRGLEPLPGASAGAGLLPGLGLNLPLWGLVGLFAAFSLLWATTLGQIVRPSPDVPAFPLTAVSAPAAAVAQLIHRTAAAFPNAKSVVLARLRPGQPADWLLVEVDGKALRAASASAGIEAALAAAGVRVDEGDRLLVLPNEGAALATTARTPFRLPVPAQRVVVQRAVPFSVWDGGVPYSGRAAASTVGEALRAVGIDVDAADLVQPPLETPLAPGLRVAILRAQPVAVAGVDAQLQGRTRAATVADLLAQWNVPLGPMDRVEPPLEAAVPAGGVVRVVRVQEEERTELRPLPYRTTTQYDSRLLPGTRLRMRVGVAGLVERLLRVVFEDGGEVSRSLAGERVLRVPVDEVIATGPAVVPIVALPGVPLAPAVPVAQPAGGPPEGMAVRQVLTMLATAYDPGPASTGKRPGDPGYGVTATGMRAGYGVVAVDPRVIPFYTRLFIPGYGYAVAADTGGAIVGHRIDLGFTTYGEAIHWGRRTVPVYVLG